MDRFIDYNHQLQKYQQKHLKSNMDRFIVGITLIVYLRIFVFKIQYG